MTHITHEVLIQCAPAKVFAFVTNFENDHYWWKAVSYTEKITPGDMNVGSEFRQVAKVLGIITVYNLLEVIEFTPPHKVQYVNQSPQLSYTLHYNFSPLGDATLFTLEADIDVKGILRAVMPLTLWSLHRQLNTFFNLLKLHLEAQC